METEVQKVSDTEIKIITPVPATTQEKVVLKDDLVAERDSLVFGLQTMETDYNNRVLVQQARIDELNALIDKATELDVKTTVELQESSPSADTLLQ